jgi:hypothetical protein
VCGASEKSTRTSYSVRVQKEREIMMRQMRISQGRVITTEIGGGRPVCICVCVIEDG